MTQYLTLDDHHLTIDPSHLDEQSVTFHSITDSTQGIATDVTTGVAYSYRADPSQASSVQVTKAGDTISIKTIAETIEESVIQSLYAQGDLPKHPGWVQEPAPTFPTTVKIAGPTLQEFCKSFGTSEAPRLTDD
jgi:hypothetical protein